MQQPGELGLTWLKAFPAADLGAGWFGSMRGPFPEVRFVATGGMSVANAEQYLDAGAAAVSLGSALSDPAQLDRLPELIGRVRRVGAGCGRRTGRSDGPRRPGCRSA